MSSLLLCRRYLSLAPLAIRKARGLLIELTVGDGRFIDKTYLRSWRGTLLCMERNIRARIASSAKFGGDKLVRGGDRSRIRVEFEIFEERTGLHGVGAKLRSAGLPGRTRARTCRRAMDHAYNSRLLFGGVPLQRFPRSP